MDKRIVKGYLIIWNSKNLHGEKFVKGCCAKSIRERGPESNAEYKIKFLNQHNTDEACALFRVLKEDDLGLYFETYPLDAVSWADNLLVQIKSGTINNFSHGWDYIWDKIEYDEMDDSLVMLEIDLFEGSAVTIPSGLSTFAIRSKDDLVSLHDDIDDFINTLPRKNRLQARKLFALQKSLIPVEKRAVKTDKLNKGKPAAKGLDFEYISKNFKL